MSQFRHEIMNTINTKPAQLRKDTLSCKKRKKKTIRQIQTTLKSQSHEKKERKRVSYSNIAPSSGGGDYYNTSERRSCQAEGF